MKTLYCLLYLTGLAGCSTLGQLPAQNGQTMAEFTLADARQAVLIAQAAGDTQGEACFAALVAVLPDKPPLQVATIGALSLLEKARVDRLRLTSGIPDSVLSACAPMAAGANRALLQGVLFSIPR